MVDAELGLARPFGLNLLEETVSQAHENTLIFATHTLQLAEYPSPLPLKN